MLSKSRGPESASKGKLWHVAQGISLLVGNKGCATILDTILLEQGHDAEELENITCVISWEPSPWLCIPLASLFLWKHIFPSVNLHRKTINGSVVLQETKERKSKWKSSYQLLLGYTLIRRGTNGNITWKFFQVPNKHFITQSSLVSAC